MRPQIYSPLPMPIQSCLRAAHSLVSSICLLGRRLRLDAFSTDATSTDYSDSHYSALTEIEQEWHEASEHLKMKGYMLRPRYRKDWRPSWRQPGNEGKHPREFEDHIALPLEWQKGIDAVQISTGRLVWIKRCGSNRTPRETLESPPEYPNQTMNHCVPLLDVLEESEDSEVYYLVMPYLRPAHDPPLRTVGDAMDFTTQLLEGLAFMHANQTVTLGGGFRHIMMDASALFPQGFHPVRIHLDPTARSTARQISRRDCPVQYYYTKFEFEVLQYRQLPTNWEAEMGDGREFAPEMFGSSRPDSYDMDVWDIGQILKTRLYNVYSNADFLQYTLILMLDWRMKASHSLGTWQGSRPKNLSAYALTRRLRPKSETWLQAIVLDMVALAEDVSRLVRMSLIWINERHG
ncbi:hypothetical protein BC629DRAFT_1471595 [Irpex lacteus]|nr:hypothetical protein BC629DRAFT_1471595 [Irpex lacteus]